MYRPSIGVRDVTNGSLLQNSTTHSRASSPIAATAETRTTVSTMPSASGRIRWKQERPARSAPWSATTRASSSSKSW